MLLAMWQQQQPTREGHEAGQEIEQHQQPTDRDRAADHMPKRTLDEDAPAAPSGAFVWAGELRPAVCRRARKQARVAVPRSRRWCRSRRSCTAGRVLPSCTRRLATAPSQA